MKTTLAIFAISTALALTSCGGSNEPATPVNAAQFEKLRGSKDNAGKRFSITGYPFLDNDVTIGNDLEIDVSLYSEPKGKGDYIGSVNMGYKDQKNGMYVPDQFTPDDLQIFDNEGKQLGVNDKITVSFTMKLDTNREPREDKSTGPTYYGDGPVDVKIEKAK